MPHCAALWQAWRLPCSPPTGRTLPPAWPHLGVVCVAIQHTHLQGREHPARGSIKAQLARSPEEREQSLTRAEVETRRLVTAVAPPCAGLPPTASQQLPQSHQRARPDTHRTSSTTSGRSSLMGCPVARSISSTRMGASHLACNRGHAADPAHRHAAGGRACGIGPACSRRAPSSSQGAHQHSKQAGIACLEHIVHQVLGREVDGAAAVRVVLAQHALRVQASQAPAVRWVYARAVNTRPARRARDYAGMEPSTLSRTVLCASRRVCMHRPAASRTPLHPCISSQTVVAEHQLQVAMLQRHTTVIWRRQRLQAVERGLLHH